jgi:serine protease
MRPLTSLILATALITSSAEAADRYLVATRTTPREAPLHMLRDAGEARTHAVRTFQAVNGFAATLTEAEAAELRQSSDVRYVTKVVERHVSADGGARSFAQKADAAVGQRLPYGIAMIHAPEVWAVTKGAGPINVAIIDTGIDRNHPDLAENYAGGYNVFTRKNDPTDDHGHGTHVAGTIGARDNDIGVIGVAPEVHIWSVKVLDHLGVGTDENIADGTDWVIAKKREVGGDWIMSLSLGGDAGSPLEEEAFRRVIAEGIIVVAAAGNQGLPLVQFPAAYDGVIAVGAVNSSTGLAAFSDYGPRMNIVAPGVGVISTAVEGTAASNVVSLSTGPTFVAASVQGAVVGDVKGHYVACGLGYPQDFPPEVKGNIALIRRGELTFNSKVRNAQLAGATSVIIYNFDDSPYGSWTLFRPYCGNDCDDDTHAWPVVLAISAADGARLLNDPSQFIDMGQWVADYTAFNGTSQATPHVSGTLALLWSLDPGRKASEVRDALLSTATDLGAPGFDPTYANGLVNALAAAKKLTPWRFQPVPEPSGPDIP